MDEEMRFHLQMEIEAHMRKGLPRDQARKVALDAFGGVERFKELSRDERGGRGMDDLAQDVRFTFRRLLQTPVFAVVVLITLALGIGANSAIFTLVDSIGKKVKLVEELVKELGLENVTPVNQRMELLNLKSDFVVSRAVTAFPKLYEWTKMLIVPGNDQSMPNGLISLKGGDLSKELMPFEKRVECFPLSGWFKESFFSSKMIVYLKK